KAEMVPYLDDLTERRRSEPRDDLLSRLVVAEVDGERLTPKEILGFFQLLLLAGTETTTNLINNAVLCLVENPGQLVCLKAQPGLLERLPGLALASDEPWEPRKAFHVLGPSRLPIRFEAGQSHPQSKLIDL